MTSWLWLQGRWLASITGVCSVDDVCDLEVLHHFFGGGVLVVAEKHEVFKYL